MIWSMSYAIRAVCIVCYVFCWCKVMPAERSCVAYVIMSVLYWHQPLVVTNDFWCELVLLFEFAWNWTTRQFVYVIYLWLQFIIVTAISTLIKSLQGNNTWGLMSILTWWLLSVVLRVTYVELAESEEAATDFNGHVEEM
jgi:hypothetical protein